MENNICISISETPGNFGKIVHNAGYKTLGLNWIYIPFKVTNLQDVIKGVRALGIRGCSVSMPFKENVIKYLDEIEPMAKQIGAVNTIVNENGILKGYNTDYIGFKKSFEKLNVRKNQKLLILGSGGVSKAILAVLKNLKFKNILISGRNYSKTKQLAIKYDIDLIKWVRREDNISEILINTTPIGMKTNTNLMPVSKYFLKNFHGIFDVIVSPRETTLIKTAKSLKIVNQSGYSMALNQAVAQFKLYTGKEVPIKAMEKALKNYKI